MSGLRVTFGSMTLMAQRGISSASTRVANAQNAIVTGKRVARASDDPGGAAQVMRLRDALGDIKQYKSNGDAAKTNLALTDSALDSAGNLIRKARDLTLQAASSNNDTEEARTTFANQIAEIKKQLVGIANTNHGGRYLFAGQKTDTKPYDPTAATLTYQGDNGLQRAEISQGEYVDSNVPGDAIFSKMFADLTTIEADIRAGDLTKLSTEGVAAATTAVNTVLGARGKIGAAINRIDDVGSRLSTAQQEFTDLKVNIEEVDVAEAIVELQAAKNAYEASLGATGRMFQTSLMDYLR